MAQWRRLIELPPSTFIKVFVLQKIGVAFVCHNHVA